MPTYLLTDIDDVFTGSTSDDFIDGAGGNDTLNGSGGRDVILGRDGNDRLFGGLGNDAMYGGAGIDTVDGGDGNDEIYGDEGNDNLNGAVGDDIIYAGIGNDTLLGGDGKDDLRGEDGDDLLNGGTGNDLMIGGMGSDRYVVDSVGDKIVELETDGIELVYSSISFDLNWGDQVAGDVENLTLTGSANINGTGNILANIINGNAGSNIINGGGGADLMQGGAGSDTYFVDDVRDRVIETNVFGVDRVSSSVSYTITGQFIENLTLTGTADINGTGNGLANTIIGNSGDNTIYAYAGADIINGATGADSMYGGEGDDKYYVDSSGDRIFEANVVGIDTVYSFVSFGAGGQFIENVTLTGSANINASGNDLANGIVGNSGNNVINGGVGADTMAGGVGNDTYYVDNTGDHVFEANGGGSDKVFSSASYSVAAQFVENIYLIGSGDINATGNNLDNGIVGNSGKNVINGGTGADYMIGGLGDDVYYIDNAGDQTIEANGAGSDKVYSSVSYSVSRQFIENIYLTGSGNLSAAGNNLANGIVGNSGNNVLNGGLGSDYLVGGAGNDFFTFNTAVGASNVDTISDFNVAQDTIRVDNAIFTALGGAGALAASAFHIGASAHDANDRIIYNSTTGALFYDSNGSAAGGETQFATLSKGLGITNADFLVV